jgi:transposase
MHGVQERVLLRHFLEQGLSIAAAARQLGVHRATVHRWIEAGLLDTELDQIRAQYAARPAVPTQLDRFKPLIAERLHEFPALTATRLFAEVQAAGYTGGYTQVKAYVRTLRPAPVATPVVRFETPPGQQAQVDFAHCRLPWGVRYALVVVLAYSRLLWVRFYPRQDLRTLLHGLETCLTAWGGAPQTWLFDQMKCVLTRDDRLAGGGLVHNAEFLRFCRHYGVTARVCRPYRAQTKGKVERPIRYLRESFLYGRTFVSDADLNAQVEHWLATVANQRVHGTTQAVPATRFAAEEQGVLQALPGQPYRPLVLPAARPTPRDAAGPAPRVPAIEVERRSLRAYGALTDDPVAADAVGVDAVAADARALVEVA